MNRTADDRTLTDPPPDWHAELSTYCQGVFRSLPRSDQRRASETYVSGLFRCPGKKSVRRITNEVTGNHSDQSLQQFVNKSAWDPAPVRQHLAGRVAQELSPTAWVVGEIAFQKQGRHSAGVERQFVRAHGRLSNCQLGVFAALATDECVVPVSWRLTLPRSWDTDVDRRTKARIPHDERHQPQWRYQVETLDDLSGDWGLPLAPVVLDLRHSSSFTELVAELDERGLEFMAQVNTTVPVRYRTSRPAASSRPADRRPTEVSLEGTLGDLSSALAALPRRTLPWREPGTDREVRAQFSCASVHTVLADGPAVRTAPTQVLLMEWGLGKQRPRAFWISNMVDRDLADLVALSRLSLRAEIDLAVMSEQLGLCDFEGRSFPGWHHHVTLVSVAYAFHVTGTTPAPVPRQRGPARPQHVVDRAP